MECRRSETGLTYIEPAPAGKPKATVKGPVDRSLKETRCSGAEESRDVPDCHSLRELGLVIPGSEEENNDRREAGLEESNHEAESVHLIRAGSRSLGEPVPEEVSLDTNGYHDASLDTSLVGSVREDGPAQLAYHNADTGPDL